MLKRYIAQDAVTLDTACGYGSFFQLAFSQRQIGCDIDEIAVSKARNNFPSAEIFHRNALLDVSRASLGIASDQNLVIVGNPPYNDRTSHIRRKIKNSNADVDSDLRSRDLGLSFLLSYAKLDADIICVLHPLSYLIKRANFSALQNFTSNYRLKRGFIVSSERFEQNSKTTHFPIVIALYARSNRGMTYNDILNFTFITEDGDQFRLLDYDFIPKYIRKYPRKGAIRSKDSAYFWPLRDINALKRNQTFLEFYRPDCIIVESSLLKFYIYVDVFKHNLHRLPYYYGNCDVFIDRALFERYEASFFYDALSRHPYLNRCMGPGTPVASDSTGVKRYFDQMMERYRVDYC